jgi:hypothetical protein
MFRDDREEKGGRQGNKKEEGKRKKEEGRKGNEIYLIRIPFEDIDNLPS